MPGYNLERLSFMVVDDHQHMRSMVRTILNTLGCKNVADAADGAEAFKKLCDNPVDVLILDWVMSPMDGMDMVRLVRTGEESPNPFIPIIMMTGFTEIKRVIQARDAGVHEFLAKPISAKTLYARIKTIIERPRPFVRVTNYFGPDRRRRDVPTKFPNRRGKGQLGNKPQVLEANTGGEAAPAPNATDEKAAASG